MADQDLPFVDPEITQLPADIRQDLAQRVLGDLYIFAKAVLGYSDMTPTCHLPLAMFLDENPARFKLVLMPRGHFKTSLCTIASVARRVLRNPNERVLILNETTDNAEGFLGAIKGHFESNRVLRALFSDKIPKEPRKMGLAWNNSALTLMRGWQGPEATIEAMGMTSALTSHHYTHLNVDDPISEEATKSEAVMSDAISRISKITSLMVHPEKSTFDFIGTRWALHDVYSVFMKKYNKKLAKYIRAAIKDGVPIFPELISLETLAQAREDMGEYMFSCLYMNNPRDVANQDFNVQDLRFWRWSSDEESVVLYDYDGTIVREWALDKLDITCSVDLAMAEKVTDDRNAIVTCGVSPLGEVIVLDTWVKRCSPLDVVQRLIWTKRRFNPRQVGIESIMYQKSLKYFLRAELEREGLYMNIVDLKAIPSKRGVGNNSKEARIRGLQPIAATGRLYVLPTMHELRSELADFPLGEHDDVIDALAYQLVMWRGLVSPQRMQRYKESEALLLNRIHAGLPIEDLISPQGRHPRDVPTLDDLGIELPQFSAFEDFTLGGS